MGNPKPIKTEGGAIRSALVAFPDGRLTWRIVDFCRAVNISRAQFYELQKVGRAPRTIREGRRPMVTPEAVQDWLRAREQPLRGAETTFPAAA